MKFSPKPMEEEEEEQNVLGERCINNNRVFQEWRTHFGTEKSRKIKMEKSCCYQIPVWNKWKKRKEGEKKSKFPRPKKVWLITYIASSPSFYICLSVESTERRRRESYVWRYFFTRERETRCLYDICYHPPNVLLHTHFLILYTQGIEEWSGIWKEKKK